MSAESESNDSAEPALAVLVVAVRLCRRKVLEFAVSRRFASRRTMIEWTNPRSTQSRRALSENSVCVAAASTPARKAVAKVQMGIR